MIELSKLDAILDEIDLNKPAPTAEPERQYYYLKRGKQMVSALSEKLGRKLTACSQTFGCQMNARDSEKLAGVLDYIGYIPVETEEADFVIYNTCTIRENANNRIYGRLGYLHNLKKHNPHMMIALCGCMMQEQHVIEKLQKSYSFVDLVFGTHNVYKFAELVVTAMESDRMIVDIWKDTDQIVEDLPNDRKYFFKSGVNITFGCNNFCTYCIVPYVRGRERSRNKEDILREIEGFAKDGVVEVMLLGQNVNSYGKTLNPPVSFAELLTDVCKIDGIERVRFMTSQPKDLSEKLMQVIRDNPKVCRHFHLPLQSGSSRILKKMNRHYDKEKYLDLVERLREYVPDISITTDIIVGFPGETEEDFQETLDVVRKVRYDSAFTFIYSKRTGTPAAAMEDQIPEEVSKDRLNRLLKEVQEIARETCGRYEGTVQEVLVEQINREDENLVTGRMGNNMLVHFPGCENLIGKIVSVKLLESKGFYYLGEQA